MRPQFPSLYQVYTRVYLNELSRTLGRPTTFDDWPDADLDRLARAGFDWIWPLGVWQTAVIGREVSATILDWNAARANLTDLKADEIVSSPFAIVGYSCHNDFGGDPALARFRQRLAKHGLRLLLDFVPNHTAIDHPWVREHPEYYITGTMADLQRAPQNYRTVDGTIFAHGRDPYFDGWPDTLQLNYRHPGLRAAMKEVLLSIGKRCDGVRCDMAMLLLPEVIERTWGQASLPKDAVAVDVCFWPEAIQSVRAAYPEFTFMAEVYWDLEWQLQREGFDYTYDKRLYDRLHQLDASAVRAHLWADPEFQRRSVHFLENHDEPRAATVFSPEIYRAAAMISYFVPGLRFFHAGQAEGKRFRVPMQLARGPVEAADSERIAFHELLMACLCRPEVRDGQWRLLDCRQAWGTNPTHERFLAFLWELGEQRLLVVVNFGPTQGQCYVHFPFTNLNQFRWRLRDLLSHAVYDRDGDDLLTYGLFVDMLPWGFHAFELKPV